MKKRLLTALGALFLGIGITTAQTIISPTGDGGFETGSTFAANSWSVAQTQTTRVWYLGTGQTGYSGTQAAFIGDNSTTVGSTTASRTVHLYRSVTIPAGAENIILSFKYKQAVTDSSYDFLSVFLNGAVPVGGTAVSTGSLVVVNPRASATYTAFTNVSVMVPNSFAGTTNNLVFTFKADGVTPHAYGAIDDVSLTYVIPTCASPSGLTISAITMNAATYSWTPGGSATAWDLYFGSGTLPVPNGSTVPTATTNVASYPASGLTPSTTYSVYVRSNCGGSDQSFWTPVSSFTTLNPPCVTPGAQPTGLVFGPAYSTSVSATFSVPTPTATNYLVVRTLGTAPNTPTNGIVYTTGANAALGGTVVSVGTSSTVSNTGLTGNTNYTYYIYAYNTGTNCVTMYSGSAPLSGSITTCPAKPTALTTTLVTTNSFNLSWTAPTGGTANPITYSVEVSSNAGFTAPIAGSPFTMAAPTASLALTGLNPATTYYYRVTADNGCNIGATTSGNVTTASIPTDIQALSLQAPATSATGCYSTHTVTVRLRNVGTTVFDFSANNATVTATTTGPNPQTFTAVVNTGTLAASSNRDVVVSTAYPMSALGTYTFNANVVLATPDANPSNDAMVAATYTATAGTPVPYSQDFAAGATPTGWTNTASNWSFGTTHGVTNYGMYVNLDGSPSTAQFDILRLGVLTGAEKIQFDYRVLNYSSTYPGTVVPPTGNWGNILIQASSDCGTTFATIGTIDNTTHSVTTQAWTTKSYPLTAYAGQSVILRAVANYTAGDFYVDIDNVNISTCFPVTALTATNIATTSADLAWTAPATGTPANYIWEVRTSGAAGSGSTGIVATGTVVAPSTSVTVTSLTASTSYTYYVISDCGGSQSIWSPGKAFATPANCPAASTPTVTNIRGYSAVATWTVGAAETAWDIYYGPQPLTAPGATTVPTATVGVTPSYTMAPLTPTTGYAVYVRANCGTGNVSTWSAVRNFTTTVSCPAPTTPTTSVLTPTMAVATWTAGGLETSWLVRYAAPTTTAIVNTTPSYTMASLAPSSNYTVQVKAICGAADSSVWSSVRVITTPCLPPNITGTTPGIRCGIGTTTLGATGDPGAILTWYNSASSTTALGTGSVFTTPSISSTTNYYVSATGNLSNYHVGPLVNATTLSYVALSNWGITFDCSAPTTLQSVAVYPGSAGTVTVAVQSDATGTTVFGTYVATFAASDVGQKIVLPLNAAVPAGTGFKVLLKNYSSSFTGFHRETSPGGGFPYTTSGAPITVTSSEWGGTTTGTYYYFYDFVATGGCESARTVVTASVTPPPAITVTTPTTVCANVIVPVAVTSNLADYSSFVWSPSTNLYTDAAATTAYTGGTATTVYYKSAVNGATTYSVTGTNPAGGCGNFGTTTMTTDVPVINATATPTAVCAGANVNLNATTNVVGTGTAVVGTNSLADYVGGPYRGGSALDDKAQWLFTAADLNAAGIYAGNITSISFSATTAGSVALANFSIKMGMTSATSLTSVYESPATTVFGPMTYTATGAAINTHVLTAPFNWDGVSSLVIQACHDATNILSMAVTRQSITNRCLYTSAAGACSQTTGGLIAYRPVIIFNGQVGTQGTGALTWQWNPGAINSNTAVVNPVNTGTTAITATYSISGTNPVTSCSNTKTVSVVVNPVPVAVVAHNSTQCGFGVPTASVTGAGGTYNWYNAATSGTLVQTGSSATYTSAISASTTFYVSEKNATCEGPLTPVTVTVTIPNAVTGSVNTPSNCPGTAVTLSVTQTGSTNTYTYSWTGGANSGITSAPGQTVSATPTAPGTYNYTVTAFDAGNNCTAISTVSVLVNPNPSIVTSAAPSSFCTGSSSTLTALSGSTGTTTVAGTSTLTLDGGSSSVTSYGNPYNYWYGGQKTQYIYTAAELTAAGLTAGNINALSMQVLAVPGQTLNSFAINIGHTSQSVAVTSAITTGMVNVYSNAAQAMNTLGANTYNFSTPFPWNGTDNIVVSFCWSNSNSGGSTSSTSVKGEVASFVSTMLIYADNTPASAVCSATTNTSPGVGTTSRTEISSNRPVITFSGVIGTVNPNITWQWNPGAVNNSTMSVSPTATGSTPNIVSYTVTANNTVTGCSNTAVQTVTVNPIPVVSATASNTTICSGTSATLTATGGTTYSWTPNNTSTAVTVVTPTTSTTYTVRGTALGCSATSTIALTVNTTPTVTAATSNSVFCAGASATLTTSGATTYTWNPGALTGASVTVTPSVTTTYTVSGATTGCVGTKTVAITVNQVPTMTISPASPSICAGASTTLTATGATTYSWSNGANTNTTVVTPGSNVTYTVQGTNTCGASTKTVAVTVSPLPTASAVSSRTMICSGETATLTASGTATTFTWNPGNLSGSSVVVSPTVTTTYTLSGTGTCGVATATLVQSVSPCTGIEELNADGISVYPNPTTGYIMVDMSNTPNNAIFEVYDAVGKLVIHEELSKLSTFVNTTRLAQGIYVYKIYSNTVMVKIGRLVKQ